MTAFVNVVWRVAVTAGGHCNTVGSYLGDIGGGGGDRSVQYGLAEDAVQEGGGGHVGDQVREHQVRAVLAEPGGAARARWAAAAGRGVIAGLGDVQLAAQPVLLPLGAVPVG